MDKFKAFEPQAAKDDLDLGEVIETAGNVLIRRVKTDVYEIINADGFWLPAETETAKAIIKSEIKNQHHEIIKKRNEDLAKAFKAFWEEAILPNKAQFGTELDELKERRLTKNAERVKKIEAFNEGDDDSKVSLTLTPFLVAEFNNLNSLLVARWKVFFETELDPLLKEEILEGFQKAPTEIKKEEVSKTPELHGFEGGTNTVLNRFLKPIITLLEKSGTTAPKEQAMYIQNSAHLWLLSSQVDLPHLSGSDQWQSLEPYEIDTKNRRINFSQAAKNHLQEMRSQSKRQCPARGSMVNIGDDSERNLIQDVVLWLCERGSAQVTEQAK